VVEGQHQPPESRRWHSSVQGWQRVDPGALEAARLVTGVNLLHSWVEDGVEMTRRHAASRRHGGFSGPIGV
jgi:hypothetical protein